MSKDLPAEERRALQRLYSTLNEFKAISPSMPVGQAMAFLLVCLHEGKPLKEIATLADVGVPTMSRQLIDLGARNRRMEPGYMLIEQRQNPLNMRENQYSISLKGKHLIKALVKHLSPSSRSA